MSDFTREELQELHCVWFNMLSARDSTNFEAILLNKLESMIENYCDHDSGSPYLSLVKVCDTCNQYLEHKLWENVQ